MFFSTYIWTIQDQFGCNIIYQHITKTKVLLLDVTPDIRLSLHCTSF